MKIDYSLQRYINAKVKPVMRIKEKYGYRIVFSYSDRDDYIKQVSGFPTKREAVASRDQTLADIHNDFYIVQDKIRYVELLADWLEKDVKVRTDSNETYYTFSGTVRNHISPKLGNKWIMDIKAVDIQALYKEKTEYSVSVARLVKTVVNLSLKYALGHKLLKYNPAEGISLPKSVRKAGYHIRVIEEKRTLNAEQMMILLEKSKETPIYIMVVLNVTMGLRRSEIVGIRYSDIDFVERTLTVERQLGKKLDAKKEDYAPKTLTKQEIDVKTESSHRVIPIPDYAFEAILEERKKYEKNKKRRSTVFQDMGYVCCSSYGRPRSKSYHFKHYKKLLKDNDLPDIRWHDLRASYCTLLLKNDFNPKAVSKLMGHAKEIVTIDVYGDNKEIIRDCVPEISDFINRVIPKDEDGSDEGSLLEIVPEVERFF